MTNAESRTAEGPIEAGNVHFLITILLSILLSLPACKQGTEAGTLTDPAGYTIAIPPEWQTADNFGTDGFIRADITKGSDMGIQVRLTDTAPENFSITAEAMIEDYSTDMSSHYGGYCTETERFYPEAGDEALTACFRSEWEDGSKWYLQLSLVRNDNMLVIFQSGCGWEDRQEGSNSFDLVVESIVFNE